MEETRWGLTVSCGKYFLQLSFLLHVYFLSFYCCHGRGMPEELILLSLWCASRQLVYNVLIDQTMLLPKIGLHLLYLYYFPKGNTLKNTLNSLVSKRCTESSTVQLFGSGDTCSALRVPQLTSILGWPCSQPPRAAFPCGPWLKYPLFRAVVVRIAMLQRILTGKHFFLKFCCCR